MTSITWNMNLENSFYKIFNAPIQIKQTIIEILYYPNCASFLT